MTEPERRGRQETATPAQGSGRPPPMYGRGVPRDQLSNLDYKEIRAAMGRGTSTLLLGTSTRALDRNLELIRTVRAGSDGPPTPLRGWRRHPSIWWKLTLMFIWSLVGVLVITLAWPPPPTTPQEEGVVTGLLIGVFTTAALMSVPRFGRRVKRWIDEHMVRPPR